MNQIEPNPYTSNNVVKTKREYSVADSVFAWLSLLFGYLFCRVFPISESPFGGFIFTLILFASALIIVKVKKRKITLMPTLALISAVVISASLILTSNSQIQFFSYSYSLISFCYFLYSAFGNCIEQGFSNLILVDFFKALIILPFCSFGKMFIAMFSGGSKGKGKIFVKIIIGVAIAIIPTVVIFNLLSYDSDFTLLIDNIFDFDFNILAHIGSLILGVPIGLYIYGLFISSVDNKCENVLCKDNVKKAGEKVKIAPPVTVIAALTPVMFIYGVFFISQWKYYISGFTGVLPEEFSYASYAREGFFQLCTVSFINLLLLFAVIIFLKRNSKFSNIVLKITVIVFSLATLILISTAIAKMAMYINTYGLTPKRVYATWFMVLIAVVFVLICIKLFVKKLKTIAVSVCVIVFMFSLVALPNTDALIAKYNVNRYIGGSLSSVDFDAMEELGASAVPSLIKLENHLESTERDRSEEYIYENLKEYLDMFAQEFENDERDIFSFTIPDALAERALKSKNYL